MPESKKEMNEATNPVELAKQIVKEEVKNNIAETTEKARLHARQRTHVAHRAKAIAYLTALGFTKKEIATELGVSITRITPLLKSQSMRDEIERIETNIFVKDPQLLFKKILPRAINTAYKLMLSKNTKDATKGDIAFKFMDRALGKPKQEVELGGNLMRQIIEELDQTKKAKLIDKNGNIQDAEIVQEQKEEKDPLDDWLEKNIKS